MTSGSETNSHFKMDNNHQHITNDFFFDSGEHDSFNDFVNSNHEGMSDFIDNESGQNNSTPSNTHINSLNHQKHRFHNQSHHGSISMDLSLSSLNGLNQLPTLHDSNYTPTKNTIPMDHINSINNSNNINNNNLGEGINDDDSHTMNINMNMNMNINDVDMESLHYLNNSNEKFNLSNSGSENEAHLSSSLPMKQKCSPKKVMDKRRGSLSLDDATNSQKRTRASGEILNYLMNEFNNNSNPTTMMRKEIALKTGMPERSVRIWFQNRRAKARKMEKLSQSSNLNNNDSNDNDKETKPNNNSKEELNSNDSSNGLAHNLNNNNNDTNMQNVLSKMNTLPMEINSKYYLIECKSLSVGSWQRIRSGYVKSEALNKLNNLSPRLLCEIMSTTDLLVILSKKDQELNYFFSGVFQNEKVLFRIFYPIINILKCSLLNQTQSMNNNDNYNSDYNETLLQIELGASPQFAVHFSRDPTTGKENANQWSICEDFSEGQQVAAAFTGEGGTGLPHILSDDLDRLKYLNTLISSLNKTESSKIISSSISLPDSQLKLTHQNQFSPLHQVSTNNSTPASINMLPNYPGFPQPTSYNLNINEDEAISQDLIYNLDERQSQQQPQNQQQQFSHHSSQAQTPTLQQQQRIFSNLVLQKKNSQQMMKPSFINGSALSNNISMEGMFNSGTVDSDQGEGKLESSDLDLFRQVNHNDDGNDNETAYTPNTNINMSMSMSGISINMPMNMMPTGMNMNMPMNMNLNMPMNMNLPLMNMDIPPNTSESDNNLLNTADNHVISSISGVDADDEDDLLKTTDENIHENSNENGNDAKGNTNEFMRQDGDESFFLGFE